MPRHPGCPLTAPWGHPQMRIERSIGGGSRDGRSPDVLLSAPECDDQLKLTNGHLLTLDEATFDLARDWERRARDDRRQAARSSRVERRGSSVDPPSTTTANGHSSHNPTRAWTSTAATITPAATTRSPIRGRAKESGRVMITEARVGRSATRLPSSWRWRLRSTASMRCNPSSMLNRPSPTACETRFAASSRSRSDASTGGPE
jgi:hypothetical protein